LLVLFVTIGVTGKVLQARNIFNPAVMGGQGMVGLPYMLQDNTGNNWRLYQGGWFQQNNNMPLYSQGAMLTVDGQNPNAGANAARLDAKTGEVVFENLQAGGCTVTRHVSLDKAGGFIRFIDVFKNTQTTPKTFQVMIQSTCNYGINTGENISDPKKKDQTMGWVGQTGANQSIVEMYAGKGSKVAPQINWPQGNNVIQATFPLALAAGKEAAIMHMHAIAPTQDAGSKFITEMKESPLLKSIPPALRRLIVNFRSSQDFIGDIEVLRGDLLDIVELRGGDSFKGTLKETGYDLQTFYGPITLPVDKVIGIINIGQFRPHQLLVTSDGQIIGGHLKKETIQLQMSSGQVTQIPLSQISRVGYRKRAGEPEEWTFDKPMVLLRTGERIIVQMPQEPIEVVTRYGKLSLAPAQVAAVQLQNEDNSVHEIELTDGSRFAGLLSADTFNMKLDAGDAVQFPVGTMSRLQLTPKVKEPDDTAPVIKLSNEDQMVGTLVGSLKLATAFDTLDINAPEMRELSHAPDGGAQDVQVSLWDGTVFTGQLEEQVLSCQLLGGVTVKVPVALVQGYIQPQPRPSAAMVEKIKNVVGTELTNEDWHVRDRARSELLSMGPAVASVLKQIRENQPPEAQKSIDVILGEFDKLRKPVKPSGDAVAPQPIDN
jgi:small nuclear ribonucleoprotein (snRNP)-like protein